MLDYLESIWGHEEVMKLVNFFDADDLYPYMLGQAHNQSIQRGALVVLGVLLEARDAAYQAPIFVYPGVLPVARGVH